MYRLLFSRILTPVTFGSRNIDVSHFDNIATYTYYVASVFLFIFRKTGRSIAELFYSGKYGNRIGNLYFPFDRYAIYFVVFLYFFFACLCKIYILVVQETVKRIETRCEMTFRAAVQFLSVAYGFKSWSNVRRGPAGSV